MNTVSSPSSVDSTTDVDPTRFRPQLEEQLRDREALVAELAPRAAPHIDIVSWSTTQSTLRIIDQINAALERIDSGTFGRCSRCAGPIATARLEIIPYAGTCVACSTDGIP